MRVLFVMLFGDEEGQAASQNDGAKGWRQEEEVDE